MSASSRAVLIGCFIAVAMGCSGEPTRPAVRPPEESEEQPKGPPVVLLSPVAAGRFTQNDPTLGCPTNETRGSGFRVEFDWEDVEGASAYDVIFWQKNAKFAAITSRVEASGFSQTNCNAFVIDANLNDWVWTVKATARIEVTEAGDSTFVVRDTVLSSEERVFGFEPCRLENSRACYAPAASPSSFFHLARRGS